MARSMTLDVLVRLKDRLSGPLRRLKDNLKSIGNAARSIGLVGTAIAAISFLAPIREAAAFEQKLIDISLTQDLVGEAVTRNVKQATAQYEALAFAVGQSSDTIASGAGQMIAAGVANNLVDASIGTIGKAATAANTEFADMAGVATSLLTTLKVPADQLEGSLAGLVVAGKKGSFELKDMAQYFPQLTGQVAKFGIKGRAAVDFLASALQIAKKGTSDPGAAANNLNNFLSKALAPTTVKNFKAMGVDIEAVMKDAAAKGINPIEAMLQKVGKLTGVSEKQIAGYMGQAKKRGLEGAEALGYVREQLEAIGAAGQIGNLFADQQVLDFLIPFLANVDEYKQIKADVAAATGSAIDADFESQMAGLNRQLIILGEIGTQAVRDVGFAFGTWLPMINAALMASLKWVRELDAATGGWVTTALVAAGGGMLLLGAIGALGLALPIVAAGLTAIGAVAAAIFSPIGLLVAALVAGAVYVGRNWDRFGPRVMRVWQQAKQGFSDFAGGVVDRGRQMIASGRELVDRYGPAIRDGIGRAWAEAGRLAGKMPSFGEIKTAGLEVFASVMERLGRVKDSVGTFFSSFSTGFKSAFEGSNFGSAEVAGKALEIFHGAIARLQGVGQGAIDRLGIMVSTVGSFFTGFGSQMDGIGSSWGAAIGELAKGVGTFGGIVTDIMAAGDRLTAWFSSLAAGSGIDFSKLLCDGAEGLGKLAGKTLILMGDTLHQFGEAVNFVLGAIKELTGWMATGESIDWTKMIPSGVTEAYDRIVAAIGNLKSSITAFFDWIRGLVAPVIPMPTLGAAIGGGISSGPDAISPQSKRIQDALRPPPANSNAPAGEKHGALEPTVGSSKFAALSAPSRQDVNVGGTVRIAVDGPGRVAGASSDNSKVSIAPDRGRAVGAA